MIYDLQKAGLLKRIAAGFLDLILLCILVVGIATVMSGVLGYDNHYATLEERYDVYGKQYNVDLKLTQSQFQELTEDQQQRYLEAIAAMNQDEQALQAYNLMIYLSLIIVTVAVLAAYLVLEFAVPMLFGNGQTVGKKIFAIAVMKSNGVKINGVSLFIRTVLGKFTIETMVPLLISMMMFWGTIGIVGPAVVLGIIVVEIVLMITSHTNATIHDTLAQTVAVDIQSQMIFGRESELVDYKKRVHEEMVRKQT